jgi:hypothetical protein
VLVSDARARREARKSDRLAIGTLKRAVRCPPCRQSSPAFDNDPSIVLG